MLGIKPLKTCLAAFLLAVGSAQAEIVWSDDFSTQPDGAFPTRDFTGNSRDDYQGATINNSSFFKVNDGVLTITDPVNATSGAGGVLTVSMDDFAPFSTTAPETPILKVSFDLRVDSYLSTGNSHAFRFVLRANGSMAAGNQVVIAFTRGNLNDGDGNLDLAFAVGSPNSTSHLEAFNSNAIGLIPGEGWMPGFDFGNYDSTDATANNSGDAFYNFTFTYDSRTGAVNGSATRISSDATNGFSAPFSLQINTGLNFSNTDPSDVFILASADTLEGVAHFDNIVVESVPEPSVTAGLLLGVAALGARRRRKGG